LETSTPILAEDTDSPNPFSSGKKREAETE
jgi:hypothetical protein